MQNEKIGFGEALCILLIVTLSHLILTLPKSIIESQGSSSILNVIYISLLALLTVFILSKLYRNFKGQDILDISSFVFGKPFKFILGIVFIIYYMFIASLLIRNTSENIKTMYFQNTPIPYITLFLLLAAGFINKMGPKTVIKCNLIIVPSIVILLTLLFLISSNNLVIERIFPVFGYGIKNLFLNGAGNLYAFSSISFLFFIMPLLKNYNGFSKISYWYVALSSLFIFLTITALSLIFPLEIASGSNIPIYIQMRQITIGDFIQRTDAFFVLIWILTILSYLSIMLAFILLIFKKITNIHNQAAVSNCFLVILLGISLLYTNIVQIRSLQATTYKYTVLILVFGISTFILIVGNIKRILLDKKKGEFNLEKK